MPENTLVNQVKIWANNAFAKKADFTWASRGVPDRFRPLMLDANGALDRSVIIASAGAVLNSYTDNAGFLCVTGALASDGGLANSARMGVGAGGVAIIAPNTATGWARGIAMRTSTNTAPLAQFGFYGTSTAGGPGVLGNAYVGLDHTDQWQQWTAALSTLNTALTVNGEVAAATFRAAVGSWGSGYRFSGGAASLFGNTTFVGIFGANSNGILISRTDANPSYMSLGNGNANSQNASLNLMTNGAAATTATLILERLAGANGTGELRHYGTGSFTVNTVNAAILYLATSNAVRMTISAAGLVGIGVAPATQKLKVLGSVAVGGDEGGTAAYTTFTNVWNETISTGIGSIKMGGTTARTNTGFLKVFNGTAARYIPTFTTITG